MRGEAGSAEVLTDVHDKRIASEQLDDPKVGTNLVLSLDERIQFAAEKIAHEQPSVTVEDRVLDPFGHHRRRRLLEAGDEARRRCNVVNAKPIVPLRPLFSRASARLNSWHT